MLFSFVNALQLQIKVVGLDIPSEFAVMAPYVITIIALAFASKRQEQPTGADQAVRTRGIGVDKPFRGLFSNVNFDSFEE